MKNFKINIKNSEFLKGASCFIVASGIATLLVSATGVFDKADCEVLDEHAHLYTNDEGFIRYINSEYLHKSGYDHQDEYISLSDNEVDFYAFINKKGLISIEDNILLILDIQNNNQDYLEYEYTYQKRVRVNKRYRWRTRTGWTSNPDNVENEIAGRWKDLSFTGNTRLVHFVYQTYKVEQNDKGQYILIEGPVVDDIRDALEDYPYIKHDFYKVVYLDPNTINYEESNQKKLVNP